MTVTYVLIIGALIVAAFFLVTAAVIAIAPYIAIAAIVCGIGWSLIQEIDKPPPQK